MTSTPNGGYQECALDMKTCPDGSSVGRDALLNCEFFSCPPSSEETTSHQEDVHQEEEDVHATDADHQAWALGGGELAFFQTVPMTPNISHRQNVCDRYNNFHNGKVKMAYALEGLQLHVLVKNAACHNFNYDNKTGINPDYPGIEAVLLDELARRGQFTWRDTFGLSPFEAEHYNATWIELLQWSMEVYDVTGGAWNENIDRIKLGVAFTEPWYDSSYILVAKQQPPQYSHHINMWNWLKPYDYQVWLLTIFTILLSGIVYQILEWCANERVERSL